VAVRRGFSSALLICPCRSPVPVNAWFSFLKEVSCRFPSLLPFFLRHFCWFSLTIPSSLFRPASNGPAKHWALLAFEGTHSPPISCFHVPPSPPVEGHHYLGAFSTSPPLLSHCLALYSKGIRAFSRLVIFFFLPFYSFLSVLPLGHSYLPVHPWCCLFGVSQQFAFSLIGWHASRHLQFSPRLTYPTYTGLTFFFLVRDYKRQPTPPSFLKIVTSSSNFLPKDLRCAILGTWGTFLLFGLIFARILVSPLPPAFQPTTWR